MHVSISMFSYHSPPFPPLSAGYSQHQPLALITPFPAALFQQLWVIHCDDVYKLFLQKHWLVFIFSVAALSVLALQPLSGSIFNVQQVSKSNMANTFSIRTLGLNPDRFQLTAFLTAAGICRA